MPDEDRAERAAELDRRSAAAEASGVPAEEWSVVRDAILAELAQS